MGKVQMAVFVLISCELVGEVQAGNSRFLATRHGQDAVDTVVTSTEDKVCESWCREQNSTEATDPLSMCERDSCKGCPMCEIREIQTAAMPDPNTHSLNNSQAEGKTPGDGQFKSSEGVVGKCAGGPHCSGKDFASCAQTQAQDNCQWIASVEDGNKTNSSIIAATPTSTEQIASIPAVTSVDQIQVVCKPECQDEVFPGGSDVRSMCEQDSCKGCPQCEVLTTFAPSADYSIANLQAEGRLPGDGQSRLAEGSASERCTGGPDCSGKDFASCERMQAQGMCKWARSVMTKAPAVDGSAAPSGTESSAAAHLHASINTVVGLVVAIVLH